MTPQRFILYFNVFTVLAFGLLWLGAVLFLRAKKKADGVYLAFFTVFFVYLAKVLDYTLIQFQSLLLVRYLSPGLILNGRPVGESTNLVPLATLTAADLKTSLLNVLLLAPFGFGLPFITGLRRKEVVALGALFSVTIELLQLATGLLGQTTFRVVDINDVIFNTTGAALGYLAFRGFLRVYRRVLPRPAHPVLRYISERPQRDSNPRYSLESGRHQPPK